MQFSFTGCVREIRMETRPLISMSQYLIDNGIDLDHSDLYLDPVLNLIQINENEEFIQDLKNIEEF